MAVNSMAGMYTGSQNQGDDEVHVLHSTEETVVSKVCRVCGDDIGLKQDGELFVACHACGFPVCRPCYDYERSEGTQCCPQCNTRYKRHKLRVAGDDEDFDADDFDEEFQIVKNHNDRDSSEEKNHAVDIPSENGDHTQQKWQTNNQPFSVQGSVKDFEGDKETLGSAEWKDRVEKWKVKQEKRGLVNKDDGNDDDQGLEDDFLMAEARQPLWRKVPIPSSKISPYRIVIVIRLVILAFFFHFRILTPAYDAYPLWLISVICEIWFALSWILDQFPKWQPIDRETYLDRMSLRFEREGKPNALGPVDVYVSSVDPLKEPPIITANTILSILAVERICVCDMLL